METRAKSMMRAPISPALDPTTSGRDVLSALAAAWSSSNGTPGSCTSAARAASSVGLNRAATAADQAPAAATRRAAGR